LDIGRLGHRFYDFVLTLLIACILLELCVGIIIIYIGNLHYYQSASGVDVFCGCCYCCFGGGGGISDCLLCCCRRCRMPRSGSGSSTSKRHGNYLSVQTTRGGGGVAGGAGDGNAPLQQETELDEEWSAGRRARGRYESEGGVLDRTDTGIETARVKLASAEVRIVRAANYTRVVEDALRRTPGNPELEEELGRSRDELAASRREKDELEAEQRLAEALYRRAFYAKEQREDRRERATFGRIARWQHAATYLLYFVMLMNVFITTFGISGGRHDTVIGVPRPAAAAAAPPVTPAGAAMSSSTLLSALTTTMKYDLAGGKYDVIISDHSSIGGNNASYLRLHE